MLDMKIYQVYNAQVNFESMDGLGFVSKKWKHLLDCHCQKFSLILLLDVLLAFLLQL